MAKSDDILREVKKVGTGLHILSLKLYGEDGFEGDIPEIKKQNEGTRSCLNKYGERLTRVEEKLNERTKPRSLKSKLGLGGGGLSALGAIIFGIGKGAGWW